MATLTTTKATLELDCYPKVNINIQQPWDAADTYLIEHAYLGEKPAILNDHWGALTCFANSQKVSSFSWVDSFCSQKAILSNASKQDEQQDIKLAKGIITFPLDTDSIWIQCPKSFDQLHWWLTLATAQLGTGIQVSLAGMAKHIPVKWLNWLEKYCDDYEQLPIKRKARLICFKLSGRLPAISPIKSYQAYDKLPISALPGVFSRDHMDIGSRFFINQLSQIPALTGKVLDLGCGNGLLSSACLQHSRDNPSDSINNNDDKIQLILCDDSALALQAAQHNLESRHYTHGIFHHTDALLGVSAPVDTILCNPPFHNGNHISTAAAERMFKQSAKLLTKDGQLLVVANRHLGYSGTLKKSFRNVKLLASDAKFVIYRCQNAK